jgi:hypothetical protein
LAVDHDETLSEDSFKEFFEIAGQLKGLPMCYNNGREDLRTRMIMSLVNNFNSLENYLTIGKLYWNKELSSVNRAVYF